MEKHKRYRGTSMAYQEFGWDELDIFDLLAKDTRQDETRQFYKYLAFHYLSSRPLPLDSDQRQSNPMQYESKKRHAE